MTCHINKTFLRVMGPSFCGAMFNQSVCMPHSYQGVEWDILAIRPSGYVEEFEIKISREDLGADKRKHKWFYYDAVFNKGEYWKEYAEKIPNRFNYLVAEETVGPSMPKWLPDYASYYTVSGDGVIKCIRTGKMIHSLKSQYFPFRFLNYMYRFVEGGIGGEKC